MIGTLLNQRYFLASEIGRGGKGVVYLAHDNLLDRNVAVKVLSGPQLESQDQRRLLQEARAVARLNHPNIVAVYDAGQVDIPSEPDSLPYIVMELVDGRSVDQARPGTMDEVLAIARQICAALEHAHTNGLLHGDLKPENVLLASNGQAKLMDFGLARQGWTYSEDGASQHSAGVPSGVETPGSHNFTSSEGISGTVFYLAPEQILRKEVDRRADLYALGVMLYELLTGQLPFAGDDPLAVLSQHISDVPQPPSRLKPDLPPEIDAILLKLLAKEPGERFASAGELALAFSRLSPPDESLETALYPNNLPVQLSRFIGREAEIDEVQRLLLASRLVTLTGSGGSGKTRLVLEVASRSLTRFPDGVWLVELSTLSDPALVPQAVVFTLNIPEQPGRQLIETLTDYLRFRRLLLLLDNCEHLVGACAQLVETLLRKCAELRILVTSREALGIAGENDWPTPPLSLPELRRLPARQPDLLEALNRSEAVQLFIDRARTVLPGFSLNETNAEPVAQIVSRLDGIPLAIELAAVRLRALTVEQIASRLDDRFNLLTVGSRTALPRQQTLRATIDWSYDLLSPPERLLFNRLAVFAGGWDLEAAEAICSGHGLEQAQILDLLTRLVSRSLVVLEASQVGTIARYRMLETIRQYAREKLIDSGEQPVVLSRHLMYYLGLSEQAMPELRSAGQVTWLERLDEERHNLRSALDWAISNGDRLQGLRMTGALVMFWYFRGYWSEGRDWLERMISAADESSSTHRGDIQGSDFLTAKARALAGAGWLADESGKEVTYYESSLALAQQAEDPWLIAYSMRGLGVYAANQENYPQALELLQQSLDIFRELSDSWGKALVHFSMGWLASIQDDPARAEVNWEEALSSFLQVGERWGMAVTQDALGYNARLQGDYKRAAELSQESLALFRQLGDKAGIATSLSRLGMVAFRRDEYQQAIRLFEESLAIQDELGYSWSSANSFRMLGMIAMIQGDYDQALSQIEQGLDIWRQSGDDNGAAWGYATRAWVVYYQGEGQKAAALWEESVNQFRKDADKVGLAFALHGLGLAYYWQNDLQRARERLSESLSLYRELKDKTNIAALLDPLGKVVQALGENREAASLLRESLTMRRDMGARRGIAESLESLACLAISRGRARRGVFVLAAANSLRQAAGAPLPPVDQPAIQKSIQSARKELGEEAFQRAWAMGLAMKIEQAASMALEELPG